ncbi:DUF6221 family protein [Streptomyces luteolifulvus]|uniref:DUF6221 family protein n=1 Tax=Streptomyces luteolifulvus TaxID=2615112 RepID=UPI001CD9BBDF|nr:DUF6221 family protein [Streptomyces luteolifulvus]
MAHEPADTVRRCDRAGCCGEWTACGNTVDFCQVDLTGFHPAIAQHIALHDPARVLRKVKARRRVLNHHTLIPAEGDPERPGDDRDDCQFDGDLRPCDDLLEVQGLHQVSKHQVSGVTRLFPSGSVPTATARGIHVGSY